MDEAKGLIITGIITLSILIGGIFFISKGSAPTKGVFVDQNILIKSDSHQTNPNGAKVVIVEFGDYRCPACKQAFPGLQQIVKDYGNKINFVFRNYAFIPDSTTNSSTNASTLAAMSAECANDQNKFWEYHDYLYQNQPEETDISMYTIDNLTKIASSLKLDETKFKSCLVSKKYADLIKKDFADGQLANVTGTPAIFINGQLVPGVPSHDDLKSVVDQILSGK